MIKHIKIHWLGWRHRNDPMIRQYLRDLKDESSNAKTAQRFLVIDTETSGLDLEKDRILSFCMIKIDGSEMLASEVFEGYLRIPHDAQVNAAGIHHVIKSDTERGLDEESFLRNVLEVVGGRTIVGHHIGFDVAMLNKYLRQNFGFKLLNRTIDTAHLAARLENIHAYNTGVHLQLESLDSLSKRLDIDREARHSATGDAFTTALVFLKLQRLAKTKGIKSL